MSLASEREAKKRLEEKNIQDRLNETFNTNGWKDVIIPICDEIMMENIADSWLENEDGKKARAMIKALNLFFSKIGAKVNAGEKAREFLNKKLKGA